RLDMWDKVESHLLDQVQTKGPLSGDTHKDRQTRRQRFAIRGAESHETEAGVSRPGLSGAPLGCGLLQFRRLDILEKTRRAVDRPPFYGVAPAVCLNHRTAPGTRRQLSGFVLRKVGVDVRLLSSLTQHDQGFAAIRGHSSRFEYLQDHCVERRAIHSLGIL